MTKEKKKGGKSKCFFVFVGSQHNPSLGKSWCGMEKYECGDVIMLRHFSFFFFFIFVFQKNKKTEAGNTQACERVKDKKKEGRWRKRKMMMIHLKSEEKKDQVLAGILSEAPGKIDALLSCFEQRLFCNVLALESEDFVAVVRDEGAGVPNELSQGLTVPQATVKQKLVQYLTFGMSLSGLMHTGEQTQFVVGLESLMKEYAQWVQEDGSAPGLHPDRYPNLRPYAVPFADSLDYKQVVLCFGSLLKQTYMAFDSFASDILDSKQLYDTVIRFDQFVMQDFLKFSLKLAGEVSRAVVGAALSDCTSIFALNHA